MNILIVVAHPDDEVLGCGAAGAMFAAAGHSVRSCILSGEAAARAHRPATEDLRDDTETAQRILGFGAPILGSFPNIALNTVPHLELVQFIEQAMVETEAAMVFTHHPRDLNNDHLHVSRSCQAAVRLSRRRAGVIPLRDLLFFETLSSTDWSVPDGRAPFDPDTFIAVDDQAVNKKLEALASYRGVIRPRPHSRSEDAVRALATLRGAQCGATWAEAFQSAYRTLDPSRV